MNISFKNRTLMTVVLVLIFFPMLQRSQALADTNVSGLISTNTSWTAANSPYIISGNILINSGVTLIVEPGVTVKFENGKVLEVDGKLVARGTNERDIVFTSNQSSPQPGDWGNIVLTDTSWDAMFDNDGNYADGSILEYCIIEYGGANSSGAIEISASHPFINRCTIRNNSASGIYAGSITLSVKITGNAISNNITQNSGYGGGGIRLSVSSNGNAIISENNISYNTSLDTNSAFGGGGIYCYADDGSSITISDNTISNNVSHYGGGGIKVHPTSNGETVVYNNLIQNNSSSASVGGGYMHFRNC